MEKRLSSKQIIVCSDIEQEKYLFRFIANIHKQEVVLHVAFAILAHITLESVIFENSGKRIA